jgi:hypothetical protein
MDPLTMGLITGGASLLGSIFSSNTSAQNTQAQIAASNAQQDKANAFTEQMSNTAYQRASTDMTKAGLNPMMMFGSGSAASTPSASTVQAPMPQNTSPMAGIGPAADKIVSSAIQAKTFDRLTQEISNLQADRTIKDATVPLIHAKTGLTEQDVSLRNKQSDLAALAIPGARFSARSASDLESLPDSVRRTANVGSFIGKKANDVIVPIANTARSVLPFIPRRSTSERTSDTGYSSFDERFTGGY